MRTKGEDKVCDYSDAWKLAYCLRIIQFMRAASKDNCFCGASGRKEQIYDIISDNTPIAWHDL